MTKQTIISSPYPTLEQTARKLGVPLQRAFEIDHIVGGRSRPGLAYAAHNAARKASPKKIRAKNGLARKARVR